MQRVKSLVLSQVRLYRPFSIEAFISALPLIVQKIVVLDRTKEPGAIGEPLYLDVRTGSRRGDGKGDCRSGRTLPRPLAAGTVSVPRNSRLPWSRGYLTTLQKRSRVNHFTIGINDDVTGTSLPYDSSFSIDEKGDLQGHVLAVSAQTARLGANKNTIKIIV